MNFLDDRLPDLFWNKLQPCPMTGCWIWIGARNKNGYGSHGRKAPYSGSGLTHRFTFETEFGALPEGTELDHFVCKTRECCNPHHVEPVTHAENVRRGNAKKTHCKRGHELAGDNLRLTKRGSRCRACQDAAHAARSAVVRYLHPRRQRPKKLSGVCSRGHEMTHNGKRLVCKMCVRNRPKPPPKPRKQRSLCTVKGCVRKVNGRGLCGAHYLAALDRGEFGRPCCIEGCTRSVMANDMCGRHNSKARTTPGPPLDTPPGSAECVWSY